MPVGIVVPLPAYTIDAAFIAQKAEELGFESIWYHEHPILPVNSDTPLPSTGGAFRVVGVLENTAPAGIAAATRGGHVLTGTGRSRSGSCAWGKTIVGMQTALVKKPPQEQTHPNCRVRSGPPRYAR